MNNAASNINSTKEIVNQRNTQMTTQKKIDKPSDDPVIAVRSLRLSTTLSQVTQYYQKNIPDASSWIEVTETSLLNIRDLITDCKTLADKGANGSLNQEDRNTIITQLESLQKAVFKEGNADYANRTVFTGYRTNSDLVFTKNETDTEYQITQTLSIEKNMEENQATQNIEQNTQPNQQNQQVNMNNNNNQNVQGESKVGIGVVCGLFAGLIGLVIGLLLYKEGSYERQSFIKGWLWTFIISAAIGIVVSIVAVSVVSCSSLTIANSVMY